MAHRGLPDIVTDLLKELTALFRREMLIARTEMADKIGALGFALTAIVIGAVRLVAGLGLLLQAAVTGLMERGFTPTQATLIVAGAVLVIGLIVLWIGLSRLRARNLTPSHTIDQLQRDAAVARHQVTSP